MSVICIILSGTFSGLTLGLMSLDIIDLRVLTESGTEKEKWCARRILPVRKHGNWLLCTLLIGNTAVNSALAIVTADLFGGIAGFMTSTICILYIGEIIPQAVCHRFGLVIGAYAIPFIHLIMYITAPLSYTTAKAIDFFLGGEPATRYNKSQLKSLLSIHGTVQPPSPSTNDPSAQNSRSSFPNHSNNLPAADIVELDQISVHPQNASSQPPPPPSEQPPSEQPPAKPEHLHSESSPLANSSLVQTNQNTHVAQESLISKARKRGQHKSVSARNESSRFNFGRFKLMRKNRQNGERERTNASSKPPLTKDEITMLGGAFDFSQKNVRQVMTALDDVFMLEASLSLNFEVMLLVFQSGHSRIPVYDKKRDNIIGVLFAKDLILLDPEDCVPIKTILLFFARTVLLVFFDTTLNKMLDIFRQGGGHMAIVQNKEEESSDEEGETLGIVTLEDLIEEIIGQDIVDETDVYTDNISKQRVKRVRSIHPEVLKMFDSKHDEELLSEREVLVVASYLSNNTEEFGESMIDIKVLRKMVGEILIVKYGAEDEYIEEKNRGANMDGSDETRRNGDTVCSRREVGSSFDNRCGRAGGASGNAGSPDVCIYTRGVPSKNAFLIMNGRLEICAGNDGFISEAGPWTFLGIRALTEDIYAPDFTARVIERPARLLGISRRLYRVMKEYSSKGGGGSGGREMRVGGNGLSAAPGRGEKREENNSGIEHDAPSSLALAAAAAAVAVGGGKAKKERSGIVGKASEVNVVRKTRLRPNGQSIEWSEMETALIEQAESSAVLESDEARNEVK